MNVNIDSYLGSMWNWLLGPIVPPKRIEDPSRLLPFLPQKKEKEPPTILDLARKQFRISVRSRRENIAVINDPDWPHPQVVGYHERPFNILEALDQGAEIIRVLNRVVPVDYNYFWETLETAWEEWPNEHYRRIIKAASEHFHSEEYGRQGFVTGPAGMVLDYHEGAPNAVAQGELVQYTDFGWLLDAVLQGRPTWKQSRNGVEGPFLHPLEVAYSELRPREGDFVLDGDTETKHALFRIYPHGPKQLRKLQNFPVDIATTIKNVGSPDTMYFDFVVWARGTQETLNALTSSLHQIGKVTRVPGYHPLKHDIERTFPQLLPGKGCPPPASLPMPGYSNRSWVEMSEAAVAGLDATGVERGNLPLGKSTLRLGKMVFLDWKTAPVIAIAGPTGTGKTTMGMLRALLKTHRVIALMLTPAKTDMPGRLAEACGGTFLRLDLPTVRNRDEYRKAQKEIENKVNNIIDKWEQDWQNGVAEGLPFVVMPSKEGTPALRDHFVTVFLSQIRQLLEDFYIRTGKRTVILIDDLISISGDVPDERLGDLPVHAGQRARDQIETTMDTIRKFGGNLILTVHAPEEFKKLWGPGFWRSIPYCVWLMSSEDLARAHGLAYLIRPAEFPLDRAGGLGAVSESPGFRGQFDFRLPPSLMKLLNPGGY